MLTPQRIPPNTHAATTGQDRINAPDTKQHNNAVGPLHPPPSVGALLLTPQRIHPNTHAATTGQDRINARTKNNAPNATHRAALVASCLRGAFPPVLLLAVCLVRAILCAVVGAGSKFKRLFFVLCVITFILPCFLLPHIWLFLEQNLKTQKDNGRLGF